MFDIGNKQFIFKNSSGRVVNIYHNDKLSICISTLSKRNLWTEPEYIFKNAFSEFYAYMDANDNYHIICQDSKGNLVYVYSQNAEWHSLPILSSKNPFPDKKHPYITHYDGQPNVFYTITHSNNIMLVHQPVTQKGTQCVPKVIDYVSAKEFSHNIVKDSIGNIYAVYLPALKLSDYILCKKYSKENGAWAKHASIPIASPEVSAATCVLGKNDTLHIVLRSEIDKKSNIAYFKTNLQGNTIIADNIIYSGKALINYYSILEMPPKIIVYWFTNSAMYYSESADNGNSWSNPSEYYLPIASRYVHCIVYSSNFQPEIGKICCTDLPGILSNGFKLAFVQNALSANAEQSPQNELKTILDENIKTLLSKINILENSFSELRTIFLHSNSKIEYLDKEISKNSIRITMVENELKQKFFQPKSETLKKESKSQNNEIKMKSKNNKKRKQKKFRKK